MDTFIYFSLAVMYALLLTAGIYFAIKERWHLFSAFLLIVIAALLYDNSILATGRYIREGTLLESLNFLRYWMHVFFTPLLILFAWQILRAAGVSWSMNRLAVYGVVFVTGFIIITESIPLLDLSLEPVWQQGVLSYKRVSSSGGPFMMMAVSLSILIASIILWRRQKWIWLFAGLIGMGVVGVLSIPFESKAAGNISELVLILSLFATQLFQSGRIIVNKNKS
ncbi:hypothetical protein MM300_10285 [Evansella sp. LMS18]|jgi:hypothetical protein|uniref:hypothetical protein n=1 Tax=Evansella sp. LMS18 TaxID=2924033 RepID=UPI0020D0CA89|nr:hypothetical protein [Evansella sp. LMS18]UTR12623.1 hypothetical protein MM300_10285 [Evansella sp. LMS18]